MVQNISDPIVRSRVQFLLEDTRFLKKSDIKEKDLNSKRKKARSFHETRIFRAVESTLALLLLIAISPLMLIIALMVVIDDGFPIFFRQNRLGWKGKPFRIFKFRTMRKDAEEILKKDLVLYEKYIINDYKLPAEEDPRVTRVGKFLRRWSLDELPQFINVVRGEMHFVGPRPIVQDEIERYGEDAETFLSVKPGITGLWQVVGRSDIGYPDRKYLDLLYIKNKTFRLDVTIFFKTFWKVITRDGAY